MCIEIIHTILQYTGNTVWLIINFAITNVAVFKLTTVTELWAVPSEYPKALPREIAIRSISI